MLATLLALTGYATLAVHEVNESFVSLPQTAPPATSFSNKVAAGDLPDVAIETADGVHTSFAATAGRVRIATMFYSHCPGVCPMTFAALRDIERQLTAQQQAGLSFVLLSLDPARDSPQTLRSLARDRGVNSPRWLLGRTSEPDAHAFASAAGIEFRPLSDGSIDHSTALVFVDSRGQMLARTSDTGETSAFVGAVRRALERQ